MLSLFDGGLERVLEEIMGEPVSLKIRSDLYCHSNNPAASLPPSLPTSLSLAPPSSSVASTATTLASVHHQGSLPLTNQPIGGQRGPNVFGSPLQSSALLPKQTGSAFLPTIPNAHHPLQASQQPLQPSAAHQLQQSTSQQLPQDQCSVLSRPPITPAAFQASPQSRHPNTFPLSTPNYYRSSSHPLNTPPATALRTPEPNCLSNFNSNAKPLATSGSNHSLKTPQELSSNLVQLEIPFKQRDSNQSPIFTSYNNNETFENLNSNNPPYFAGGHDLGSRAQPGLHLNNNISLPQKFPQSTVSFQESFSTPQSDISSSNMPPIEVPKDSAYSPSSSPPSSISSSVVPTKNSSANIENETTYPCSTAAFESSASFYGAKFVTSIETTSKCTLTSKQADTALQVLQQPRDKSSGVIQGDFEENQSDTSCDVIGAHRGEPSSLGLRSNPPSSVDESQSTAQDPTRDWSQQTSSCCVCSGHQRTDVVATAPVMTCSTIAEPGDNTPRSLNSENPSASTFSVSSINLESIVSAPQWRPTDSTITVEGRDTDSILLNADPDRMSTPDILKMARYYKTMMPSMILPQSSADRGDLSIIQKLTAQRHLYCGSHVGRNEGDSGDIIDVVRLDGTNSTATSRAAEESGTSRPTIDVESLQFSSFIHRENIRQQLLREHGAKTIPYPPALYPKPSFPSMPLAKGNPSEGVPVAPCNEATLDLSTRPKGPTPRPESPFIPIQAGSSCHSYHDLNKGPDHTSQPSCLETSRKSPYSPTRALLSNSRIACLSSQVQEGSGGFGSIPKASEGGRSEGQLLDLPGGLPSSNLPPHILAWLLSSHLNPLQRAQMSPAVGVHPPSSLLSLGSFYIPSPAESPDDPLMDAKPLDLSSKTLNSDPTVSWMTPDTRCDHHSFGHKAAVSGVATSHHEALLSSLGSLAASFDKAESPATESGSTDDGSVVGISRIHGLSSGALLKQFGSSLSGRSVPGLGAHGSLSTEDLISRVLEAKASGRGRRRTDQSKRSYTDTDLQAALRDIQNGKLGTRRAAVIYGIPRSTLRNKVYKLAIEKERTKKILEQTTGDSMTLLPMPEDAAFTSSETLRALLRNKMAIKLEEITKVNPAELNLDDDDFLERKQAQDPALGHLLDNLTTLALNSEQREMSPGVMSSLSLYPNLEDFTKKMIEKRYNEEIAKSKSSLDDTIRDFCVMNGLARNPCDLNLNVPSYEPASNSHQQHNLHQQQHQQLHQHLPPKDEVGIFDRSDKLTESSQRIVRNFNPVNFQDLIAHYMGQKTGTMDHKKQAECNREDVLVSSSTVQLMTNPNMAPQQQLTASTTASVVKEKRGGGKKRAGSPVNNPGGKGSRPKRGKYRNYDRENLIKAVQAVQSGEMSVHRAGSFYGVPHSTLEYKVKERHLNRGKKKDVASTSTSAATVSTKCTTTMPSRPTMVPTNSFTLDQTMLSTDLPRYRAPDDSTIDLTDEELSNARENAHNEAYHVAKKIKLDAAESEEGNVLPNASQNPFNLWNSSPSLLPPFMAVPYERDSFYASQMIRRFQEAATSKFGKDYSGRASAVSPTLHRSEQDSPMQGQSSGSCSPNLEKERKGLEYDSAAAKSSVLDALLRGKSPLEAAAASINPNSPQPSADFGANPWSVSSRLLNLSKQLTKAQEEKNDAEAVGTPTGTSGLAAFNALCSLPSVLGLQTSLAAALQRRVSPSVEVMHKEGITNEIVRTVYPAHQASGITSHANSDTTYSQSSSTHALSDVTNASVTAHVHGTTQTESTMKPIGSNHASELVGVTLPTPATQAGASVTRPSGPSYISPSDSTAIYSQAQSITIRDQPLNMAGTHGFQECNLQTRERESTVNVVDNNQ